MPREYEAAQLIDRFGATAVYGRLLGVGEMRRMLHTEAIIGAYHARENYRDKDGQQNFSEWASQHKAMSKMLNEAAKAASDDGE